MHASNPTVENNDVVTIGDDLWWYLLPIEARHFIWPWVTLKVMQLLQACITAADKMLALAERDERSHFSLFISQKTFDNW